MNASLLAALASPGAKPVRRPTKPSSGAGSNAEEERGKENMSRSAATANRGRPRAPSFTVPEPPSTPGRMENLRCVGGIDELRWFEFGPGRCAEEQQVQVDEFFCFLPLRISQACDQQTRRK